MTDTPDKQAVPLIRDGVCTAVKKTKGKGKPAAEKADTVTEPKPRRRRGNIFQSADIEQPEATTPDDD